MNVNRFDIPNQSSGEGVTAAKLNLYASMVQGSVLALLTEQLQGPSGRRSGVVSGFGVTPGTDPGQVIVDRGLGMYYASADAQYQPVVVETSETVTLDAPDATHDRYDLICLRSHTAVSSPATVSKRLPDGTITTASLYQLMDAGVQVVYTAGTPAASPVVPNGALYDLPVAVVLVTAGASPHVIGAGDVFDVRRFLAPYAGGIARYMAYGTSDGSGDLSGVVERCSDPSIHVATHFVHFGGVYSAVLAVPKPFSTAGLSTYFGPSGPVAGSAAAVTLAGYMSPAPAGTASYPDEIYDVYLVVGTPSAAPAGDYVTIEAGFLPL